MSMVCRPMWPFLLMYGSHDMRHNGFPQVDGGQRDPQGLGRYNSVGKYSINFLEDISDNLPTNYLLIFIYKTI